MVRVSGHGSFRKRILELGFIKGNVVNVVLNAPLRDPIEYEVIGYRISLRREEADMIEVISETEAKESLADRPSANVITDDECDEAEILARRMKDLAEQRRHVIRVALVGNPNCGKTSLFNIASGGHEHVGNYSGVTVDAKEGHFEYGGYRFVIVDLPGTYSISGFSPEELYVRKNLVEETPDIIINVVDSSNLERNLYLTTQLIDMNLRVVMALNMFDELEAKGDELDIRTLGHLLGMPLIPTVSRTGKGIHALFDKVIELYENPDPSIARHIHINHGAELEQSIDRVKLAIQKNQDIRYKYSTRYLAIRFLENERTELEFRGTRFHLIGASDTSFRTPPDWSVLLPPEEEPEARLVMTHSPDAFDSLPDRPLVGVAGHTHGGQIRLPLLGAPAIPSRFGQRYAYGVVREGNRTFYITAGLGTSTLPWRFNCPPEIALIELRSPGEKP